jgi:hypothetical protein
MKKYILLFLLLEVLAVDVYSQPAAQWIARFNGLHDSTDVAKAVAIDNQGNVYVTGYSTSLVLITQIVTIKYSPAGVVLWTQWYGGLLLPMFSGGNAIVLDDSNNVYVAGTTSDLLFLLSQYVVLKYNSAGVLQWVYTHSGTSLLGQNVANALVVDNQHNVYATGAVTNGLVLGNLDYSTVKLNINGAQQWVANYDGTGHGDDIAYKIALDQVNNVAVTGASKGSGSGTDYATVKYNPGGVQQWVARYNGTGNGTDTPHGLAVDNSGNVFVTGESTGGNNTQDYATMKYNGGNGSPMWVARYDNGGNDRAYAIVIDNTDNAYITGESEGSSSSYDYSTIKYNQNGGQQWVARYNGPGNSEDRAYAIVIDNTDNAYVTGSSRHSSSPGSEDYSTLKYDTAGNQQWVVRYGSPGSSRAYAIVIDNTDNVYVTGSSRHNSLQGSEDYLTIKYSTVDPVKSISGIVPKNFNLYQNYPNPFNPATVIKVDIASASFVRLAVYDMLGNEISLLVNQKLNAGSYDVKWDASNYSSGIYFYKLITDNTIETRKMILIK